MQKNLETIGTYTEIIDLIFKAFKQIIHLVTRPFKKISKSGPTRGLLQVFRSFSYFVIIMEKLFIHFTSRHRINLLRHCAISNKPWKTRDINKQGEKDEERKVCPWDNIYCLTLLAFWDFIPFFLSFKKNERCRSGVGWRHAKTTDGMTARTLTAPCANPKAVTDLWGPLAASQRTLKCRWRIS